MWLVRSTCGRTSPTRPSLPRLGASGRRRTNPGGRRAGSRHQTPAATAPRACRDTRPGPRRAALPRCGREPSGWIGCSPCRAPSVPGTLWCRFRVELFDHRPRGQSARPRQGCPALLRQRQQSYLSGRRAPPPPRRSPPADSGVPSCPRRSSAPLGPGPGPTGPGRGPSRRLQRSGRLQNREALGRPGIFHGLRA